MNAGNAAVRAIIAILAVAIAILLASWEIGGDPVTGGPPYWFQ